MGLFGFGKKKASPYGQRYPHASNRNDWDTLNRELFHEVVQAWPGNALALISNSREGSTDLTHPYIRPGRDLAPGIQGTLSGFSRAHFDRIFDLARAQGVDGTDCLRVKRLGLPDNALVFLIEHSAGTHRTLLAFGGEWVKGKLESRLELVGKILERPDTATGRRIAAEADAPPLHVKPLDNPRAISGATDAELEARESALANARDALAYKERTELEHIQVELKRRAAEKRTSR